MQREALKRSLPAPAFTRSSTRTVARVCASVFLANKQGESPVKFVQRNFPDDADAEWLTRAATTPTSTATGLAATVTAPFLRALAPVSAATRLFSRAMQLDFDGVYQYLVPTYSSAAPIPIFVGEGAPFPVVDAMLTNATVGPTKKILLGSAVTGELESASAESAAAIIGSLTYQTARAIDHYVFDDQPADDIRPGGLLYGVTPLTAGTSMAKDISQIASAIAAAGGSVENIVFVAGPAAAVTLKLMSSPNFDYPVFGTGAIPDGMLIGVDSGAIATGYAGIPEVETAKSSVLHFSDDAPLPINDGVMAAPTRSAFQMDSIHLRCRLNAAWASLRPGTIQVIETNW